MGGWRALHFGAATCVCPIHVDHGSSRSPSAFSASYMSLEKVPSSSSGEKGASEQRIFAAQVHPARTRITHRAATLDTVASDCT